MLNFGLENFMQLTTIQHNIGNSILSIRPSLLASFLTRRFQHLEQAFGSIPPTGLVLLSSFALQVATAYATTLFDSLGVIGAAFVCQAFATILLLLNCRLTPRKYRYKDYALVCLLGLSIAGMTLSIYGAIARLPLGIASTLEFIGPLSVAVAGSRQLLDLLWVTLAVAGIILLNPITHAPLDPFGIGLALVSGGCWAAYIILSNAAGQVFPGRLGLALAMAVATLGMLPFGILHSGLALLSPSVLIVGIGVAVLGTVVPFSMEYKALKHMPPRIFGVLMSIEPAIAALVGFLFLGQILSLRSIAAMTLVTLAAAGATFFGRHNRH